MCEGASTILAQEYANLAQSLAEIQKGDTNYSHHDVDRQAACQLISHMEKLLKTIELICGVQPLR